MMSLDDRTTDGQSDAHAAVFCRVEGVEQLVEMLTVEADAGVPNDDSNTLFAVCLGPNDHSPGTIVNARHCLGGVAKQVQDDLLELDAIAHDEWKRIGELQLQSHAVSLEVIE